MARRYLGPDTLQSATAITVGFVFVAALSVGTDAVMRVTVPNAFGSDGTLASNAVLGVTQFYVALFAVTGCYLAARLAPQRPMEHALALGGFGLVFTALTVLAMWGAAPSWYHAISVLVVMPYAWLGGRLREVEVAREAVGPVPEAERVMP